MALLDAGFSLSYNSYPVQTTSFFIGLHGFMKYAHMQISN